MRMHYLALTVIISLLGAIVSSADEPGGGLVPTATLIRTVSGYDLEFARESNAVDGLVSIEVRNDSETPFQVDIWKLGKGAGYEEFKNHIIEERDLALAGREGLGPPEFVSSPFVIPVPGGERFIVTRRFAPGTYAIALLEPLPDIGIRPVDAVGPLAVHTPHRGNPLRLQPRGYEQRRLP